MGKTWIKEFVGGLDTRRLPETSPGGTLIEAVNCRVNSGGEIEQRAVFQHIWTAPGGSCAGLASDGADLTVFGSHAGAPAGLPSGWAYQQLVHPSGYPLVNVEDWDLAKDELVVVGLFQASPSNFPRALFVDGTRVTDANVSPNLANSGYPHAVKVYGQKCYVGAGAFASDLAELYGLLFFSALRDATDYGAGAGTGDGFIDTSWESSGSRIIRAIEEFDQQLALLSEERIQLWRMDADPDNNALQQVLPNTGTRAPRTVLPFADSGLVYLHHSGIRSLRARDSSRAAAAGDIGSAIDGIVAPYYRAQPFRYQDHASAVVEPLTGDLWIAVREKIFVFSYYPERKISAWTVYEPGFAIDTMVVHKKRVYLRAGDAFYIYGGTGEYAYSETVEARVSTPYFDADEPARAKLVKGIDAAVRGTWELRAALDPRDQNASDKIAIIGETTYPHARIPYDAEATHISLQFICKAPKSATEPAIVSSAIIHHDLDAAEDA